MPDSVAFTSTAEPSTSATPPAGLLRVKSSVHRVPSMGMADYVGSDAVHTDYTTIPNFPVLVMSISCIIHVYV